MSTNAQYIMNRDWTFDVLWIGVLCLWAFGVSWKVHGQSFDRITDKVGLGMISGTNGVALADYDQDGDVDVYFVSKASYDANDSETWNRLFENRGNGVFVTVSGNSLLAGRDSSSTESSMGHKMGASWGDYDNNGWPDLYLTHLGPNQLLKNNGDGTFSDITEAAGVAGGPSQLSSSSLWWDFDVDGDLDLYVSNYEDFPDDGRNIENLLFENLGDDKFREIGAASGLNDAGMTWTTVAIDANHDGFLDLYLANDFGSNKLYVNNGDGLFLDQTVAYGLEDKFHGMGIAVGDCDANGFFDIYLTNITETSDDREINPLFLNTGQDSFLHRSTESGVDLAGWGWGTAFFDLENDGDEDLFVATGYFDPDYENVLFRNDLESGQMVFTDVSRDYNLDDKRTARGLGVFDFDKDGDEDILVSNFSDPPSLFENPLRSSNWLSINLEGVETNRDGFGAVVTVRVGEKSYKKYHHGAQYLGQNILPVHFGLGRADVVDGLTITWPSGIVDEIGSMPANQSIKIVEGQGLTEGVQVSLERIPGQTAGLTLLGSFPNPFREFTEIRLELSQPGTVTMEIYDVLGRRIDRQRFMYASAGVHAIEWSPSEDTVLRLGDSVLMYILKVEGRQSEILTGKMIYIK